MPLKSLAGARIRVLDPDTESRSPRAMTWNRNRPSWKTSGSVRPSWSVGTAPPRVGSPPRLTVTPGFGAGTRALVPERVKVPTDAGAPSGNTTTALPSEPAVFDPSFSQPSPTSVSQPSSDWSRASRPSSQARVAAEMSSGGGAAATERRTTVGRTIGSLV